MKRFSSMMIGLLAVNVLLAARAQAVRIKINGSTTVNPVVSEAAQHFNQKKGWEILVDTQGGSSGGISSIAQGLVEIGMSSRSIAEKDHKKFPGVPFQTHVIGYDGVALVVSDELYEAGVQVLDRNQIQKIYEGSIKSWKEVGGPDRPIAFFNKEPGRGTWEIFAHFVYGDNPVPKTFHPEVGSNQEARTKVAQNNRAISQLSAAWALPKYGVRPVAIRHQGEVITPSMKNIQSGKYPLKRPLLLVTKGQAEGYVQEFIEFLKGSDGQKIVAKFGYISTRVSQ